MQSAIMILLNFVGLIMTALFYFFSSQEVAESVRNDFGNIDILVHSLANGPEVPPYVAV